MNAATLLWIALGGAAGSVLRALVSYAMQSRFPGATLVINAAGSLLIGWLMSRLGCAEPVEALRWRALLVTGFCGGFTTFSVFSLDAALLYERGAVAVAAGYVVASVALAILGLFAGLALVRAMT